MKKTNANLTTCASLVCFLVFSTALGTSANLDFIGTISGRSGHVMLVNITESSVTGLNGTVKVMPMQGTSQLLHHFFERNSSLGFDIKGHDVDGNLVCDIYYNGTNLNDLTFKQVGIPLNKICEFFNSEFGQARCEERLYAAALSADRIESLRICDFWRTDLRSGIFYVFMCSARLSRIFSAASLFFFHMFLLN